MVMYPRMLLLFMAMILLHLLFFFHLVFYIHFHVSNVDISLSIANIDNKKKL